MTAEGSSAVRVRVANRQEELPLDFGRLKEAVRLALARAKVARASVTVAVLDDAAIAELNERFLQHSGPTDVLSFPMEVRPGYVEGDVVVSAQTAARAAPEFGWSAHDELLLYVIHGALHLGGFDDRTTRQRGGMRREEQACLAGLGIRARLDAKDAGGSRGRPAATAKTATGRPEQGYRRQPRIRRRK